MTDNWLALGLITFGLSMFLLVFLYGSQNTGDWKKRVERDLATCRAMRGEPNLKFTRSGRYYVEQCWLAKEEPR